MEKELRYPALLCDDKGLLNKESVGWAKKPLITSNLSGQFMRKKKWNYWCIFGQDALFSATISHLDYAAVCFVYYLEYSTNAFYEKTILIPLGLTCDMPDEVQESVEVIHKDTGIFFIWNEDHVTVKVDCTDFGGKPLRADIKLNYPPGLDTLNVVVPWSEKTFQFTAKHHCLPASGHFSVGDKTFTFNPETDYGVLDYGRGVWPRKSTWNWGMASGKQGENTIGLNFGGKWTDNTGSTENAVIFNGDITKISEDVMFTYDNTDYKKPWKIETKQTDHVSLTFEPYFERVAASNVIVVNSTVHQMVGRYYGKVKLTNGDELHIDGLRGCIEEHKAKW